MNAGNNYALWDRLSSRSIPHPSMMVPLLVGVWLLASFVSRRPAFALDLSEPLRTITTPHFELQYDTSDEAARMVADFLEPKYGAVLAFCRDLRLDVQEPRAPLNVQLFAHREDFEQRLRDAGLNIEGMSGLYDETTNATYLLSMIASRPTCPVPAADLTALIRQTLSLWHEAAHQVLFNIGVHVRGADNPPWLTEGLACWFESPAASLPKSREGYFRLADLRAALKSNPNGFEAAIESGRLLPLRKLVAAESINDWPADQLPFRYAQSWSLVHFLVHERREAFAGFLTKLSQRKPYQPVTPEQELAEFESAFGGIETVEREWQAHVQQLLLLSSKP